MAYDWKELQLLDKKVTLEFFPEPTNVMEVPRKLDLRKSPLSSGQGSFGRDLPRILFLGLIHTGTKLELFP